MLLLEIRQSVEIDRRSVQLFGLSVREMIVLFITQCLAEKKFQNKKYYKGIQFAFLGVICSDFQIRIIPEPHRFTSTLYIFI